MRRFVDLVPLQGLRPRWSSAAFLVYAGVFVVLAAGLAFLDDVGSDRSFALAAWSALALVVALVLTGGARQAERPLLAGLGAFVSVIFLGTFVAALESWLGLLPADVHAFHLAAIVVEATLVAAALAALRLHRFSLLLLIVAAVVAYFVVGLSELVFGDDAGARAQAAFALLAGGLLAWAGAALDRSGRSEFGFWPWFVGAATAGGGLVALAVDAEWGWLLVSAAALAYVAFAALTGRSVFAVLGALGVVAASSHYIDRWLGFGSLIPFSGSLDEPAEGWQIALAYVVVGLLLVLLGLLVLRRDRRSVAA